MKHVFEKASCRNLCLSKLDVFKFIFLNLLWICLEFSKTGVLKWDFNLFNEVFYKDESLVLWLNCRICLQRFRNFYKRNINSTLPRTLCISNCGWKVSNSSCCFFGCCTVVVAVVCNYDWPGRGFDKIERYSGSMFAANQKFGTEHSISKKQDKPDANFFDESNTCFMAINVTQVEYVDFFIVWSNILLLRMRMSVLGHHGLF